MPTEIETYFTRIAAIAQEAVRAKVPQPRVPPVFDVPQDASATAWTAIAVHPMSVLETEYVAVVQAAEKAAGNDDQLALDNGFKAMSGFFALSSAAPSLLDPDAPSLIEDQVKDLRARFEFADALRAERRNDEAYDELKEIVGDAAALLALMTDAATLAQAAPGLQAAAIYLGMFALSADQASVHWTNDHADKGQLNAYFVEVHDNLLQTLLSPTNAAASPRSLYNIEPFYLYRLMHRFLGGDQAAPMDLASKRIASDAATGSIHNAQWGWLTKWHEAKVVELNAALKVLDGRLQQKFGSADEIIRFHLKGGRAMNTVLGTPANGSNDWDTGILINPEISPEQWYEAFAEVNDLVVSFLDHARFGYTTLLNAHAAELNAPVLAAAAAAEPIDLHDRPYSRLALQAEHQEERSGAGDFARNAIGALADVRRRVRAVGINGELIDIGIAKRSSVELAEHWHDTKIIECQGAQVPDIPVPTLPYFVDDFSTIIREALARGTADDKLAKRLVRLNLVLNSADATLRDAMTNANAGCLQALPQGATAFGTGTNSSVSKLKAWSLAGLLRSLPDTLFKPDWLAALDSYLAQQAAELLDQQNVSAIWNQMSAKIAAGDQAECLGLLCTLNAVGMLSGRLLADAQTLARAIGGDDLSTAPCWQSVSVVIQAVMALSKPRSSDGFFYLAGGLAARLQAQHADIDSTELIPLSADGVIEITYRLGQVDKKQALGMLATRLNQVLGTAPLKAQLVETTEGMAVVVKLNKPVNGMNLVVATPAVVIVRPEQPSDTARILDYVNGLPIASSRDLIRQFRAQASRSPDFEFRHSRQDVANYLLNRVLGRQLS